MSRLAYQMGVPLSRLQGRPTPLQFEFRGEKVTALLASPWTDDDVAAALAVQQAKDAECPGCGGDLELTTDYDHRNDWKAEAVRCHNCTERHLELDKYDPETAPGRLVRSWFEPDERMAR